MRQIKDYFQKFKKIVPRDTVIRDRCIWIIESILQMTLERDTIRVERDTVWIDTKAAIKHEIKRHEPEIISYINANPYGHTINSIR